MTDIQCKRVLLKVSGEALMDKNNYGYNAQVLKHIAEDIHTVFDMGIQVCVVVGGGNIYRGINASSIRLDVERTTGDYMGMLATVINALALQDILAQEGICTRVQSSISMARIAEPFLRNKAIQHMEKGRVVIFAAGIGSPYFTTDSAAVLRAIEMKCDFIFKGTNVDGVYNKDPLNNIEVTKYQEITYEEVLKNNLKVMDMTAITMAMENNLPIKVFSIKEPGNFVKVINNQGDYTIIRGNKWKKS